MALEQKIQQDLSRGTNVVTNPWDIGNQQSVFLGNCMLDEHGSIRTRDGTTIVATSPDVQLNAIGTFAINLPGTGYAVGDTGVIGAGGATYLVNAVDGGGGVTSLALTFAGAGYGVSNIATSTGGAQPGVGVGLTIDINSVTTAPPPYRPIIKLFDFILSDGTIYKLVILQGISQQNQLYRRDTDPWTLIGTMNTKFPIPDMLTFVNLAIIADGYETPWSWDGTTFQQLMDSGGGGGVPAGAQHHALHQGFYWVWNTAPGSGPQPSGKASLTIPTPVTNASITYTATTAGAAGNGITIGCFNGVPTPDQVLAVIVIGQQITVLLATDSTGVPTSTALDVIALINADFAASTLVTATLPVGSNGTALVAVQGYTALTGGSPGAPSSLLDGPSSLRSSDLNNPNSWPAANQIFVDKDDGDQGMGMGQFTIAESGISPTTSQILFKAFTAYQMTGVFGSTSPAFTIQKVKSDMGCVSPRTIQFAPGFGLIRLTHRGFALFDGVDDRLISEEVRPLIFGNEVYTALNWSLINTAYATVVANPPMYVAYTPTGTTGLDRVFMYDLVRKAWAIFSFAHQSSTVQSIRDPGVLPIVLTGDFSEGRVREAYGSAITDDGTPITVQWLPKPVAGGSPQQNALFRRGVLKVTDADPARPITVTTIFGPVTSNPPRQITKVLLVPVAVGLGLGYGLLPYGTSPYGGIGTNAEVDLTFDLNLIGTNARAIISWQGPLRVRGIEWHTRTKPLRRVSLYTRQLPQ